MSNNQKINLTMEITIQQNHIKVLVFDEDKEQIGMISEIVESYRELDRYFRMFAQVLSTIQHIVNKKEGV